MLNKQELSSRKWADSNSREAVRIYFTFTIIFCITAVLAFLWFGFSGRSFIWKADGLTQHYNALVYYGKYLREILSNVLSGNFAVPLWDFKIGFGADIPSTLNYYVYGDPLNLLAVFVPSAKMDYLYGFLILLRLYLSGVSFIAYCRFMKKENFASLCAAVAYAFCGYAFLSGLRHPFFLNPMIYLPLFLIGIELIFKGKKPYLFIGITAVSAMSNFYFFYMLSIVIVLYAIWRFFFLYKERRVYHFFISLRNFAGFYAVGLLLSCILFLPTLLLFSSGERSGLSPQVPLLYSADYYKNLLFGVLSGKFPDDWSTIAFSPFILPAVGLMFLKRKKYLDLKIALAGFLVLLLIPYAGHVMNGFSYVTNRWSFAVSFLFALILATMIPELFKISRKHFLILLAGSGIYLGCYFVFINQRDTFLPMWGIMCISVVLFYLISVLKAKDKLSKCVMYGMVMVPLILGITLFGYAKIKYHPVELTRYPKMNEAYTSIISSAPSQTAKLKDPAFFRFDRFGEADDKTKPNDAMLSQANGMSYYFSLGDSSVSDFLSDLMVRYYLSYYYDGLDNRTSLETLANVKYQVAGKNDKNNLYGYKRCTKDKPDDSFVVYENQFALPFGYTYEGYIPKEVYDALSPLRKQQALLQGALVEQPEEKTKENLKEIEPQTSERELSSKMEIGKGITYKEDTFIVKKSNSKVILTFQGEKNAETYLRFENLTYIAPKGDKKKDRGNISVKANGAEKAFYVTTPYHRSYEGKTEYLVNSGYSEEPLQRIEVLFEKPGTYKMKKMSVLSQSMEGYEEQVLRLKEDTLKEPVFGTNKITGSIALDSRKLLCLTIPYSKGWTAYVDGKKTDLVRTNIMYSGVFLEPGNHTIEFTYFTPGMKLGGLCFCMGVILLFIIALSQRRRS